MPLFKHIHQQSCIWANKLYTQTQKAARTLQKIGISANLITLSGIGFALLALNFLALQNYLTALICLLLNRTADLLDGPLARQSKISAFGIFFDLFADITSAALFILGFILGNTAQNGSSGAFYLAALSISSAALLGYACAAKQDIEKINRSPFKICLWGTIQNLDVYTAIFLMCLMPKIFIPIAIFFGLLLLGKSLLIVSGAYYHLQIEKKAKA